MAFHTWSAVKGSCFPFPSPFPMPAQNYEKLTEVWSGRESFDGYQEARRFPRAIGQPRAPAHFLRPSTGLLSAAKANFLPTRGRAQRLRSQAASGACP